MAGLAIGVRKLTNYSYPSSTRILRFWTSSFAHTTNLRGTEKDFPWWALLRNRSREHCRKGGSREAPGIESPESRDSIPRFSTHSDLSSGRHLTYNESVTEANLNQNIFPLTPGPRRDRGTLHLLYISQIFILPRPTVTWSAWVCEIRRVL